MKLPLRSMICAPKDYYLLSLDLSQAETWIVAYRSNNRMMKDAIINGKKSNGTDIHSITASYFYSIPPGVLPSETQRFIGKKGNHQCSYKGGWFKLMESINAESDKPPFVVVTASEAKKYHVMWNELYNLQLWWNDIYEQLQRTHRITTVYRRIRDFFGPINEHTWKSAIAHEPQSTIADHMLGAIQPEVGQEGGIRTLYKRIILPSKGEIRIINTSHDSAILEIPKVQLFDIAAQAISIIKRPMIINDEEFTVPVDAEYGERWGEMEKVA